MSVALAGLRRRFGPRAALDGIDLEIADGEFLALLGPSGSGKTTLLRAVAGLERLDEGRILIGGRDVTAVPARRRELGFVFQSYALFRHMSVFENVAFGLRVRPRAARPAEPEIRARVGELLDLVQLSGLSDRLPGQLSGGQQQRVALARALAPRLDQPGPRVLLLDEPFGALDAPVRKSLRLRLRRLHDRLRLTCLFVTHDQEEAREMADRLAVLRAGRLEQVGTAAALEAAPASAFVFGFLGETVRFPGRIAQGWLQPDQPGLAPIPSALPDGPAVAVARPHEVRLLPGDGPARILRTRDAGPVQRVDLELGGSTIEILVPAGTAPPPGTPCGLDASAARVLAPDITGRGDQG